MSVNNSGPRLRERARHVATFLRLQDGGRGQELDAPRSAYLPYPKGAADALDWFRLKMYGDGSLLLRSPADE
jgi:hypothetical protein